VPAQTARRTHARTAAGRSAAPRHARRLSGPTHALRGDPRPRARAVPATGALAGGRAVPRSRQRTSSFERLGRLPDHRLVDGLLRSRAWIVVVGVLLGGIVAMQVSLLKLNSGISRAVEASATLERQNADMQDRIARLSSGQRVSTAATKAGMVFPLAGDVTYLRPRPARDASLATARMTPPSPSAIALMAAGGHGTAATAIAPAPGVASEQGTTPAGATTSTTAAPSAATAPPPVPPPPATTATTTPAPTPSTTTPAATTATTTSATAASGQG